MDLTLVSFSAIWHVYASDRLQSHQLASRGVRIRWFHKNSTIFLYLPLVYSGLAIVLAEDIDGTKSWQQNIPRKFHHISQSFAEPFVGTSLYWYSDVGRSLPSVLAVDVQ